MSKDYKNTLNIFNGKFDMRANLTEKEPKIRMQWELNDVYNTKNKIALTKNAKKFILHDGPPYSNGDLHLGHALNKILKDFIVRWHASKGEYTSFIFGWDNHGLPIENAIEKSGVDRKKDNPIVFREKCKKYALEQVENQLYQFKNFGIYTDYSKYYTTCSDEFVFSELSLYEKMVEKELIYRELKPIHWSYSSESALAENEIIYQDVKAETCYTTAKISKESKNFVGDFLIFWTTLPWTIPANQMIAIGKDIIYLRIIYDKKAYILSKDIFLNDDLAKRFGWNDFVIDKEINSDELDGIFYESIWDKTKPNCLVKIGNFVQNESGTGLVGICGGFGEDDFILVKSTGLEPFVCVDKQGKFTKNINDALLEGVFIDKVSKIVIEKLKERNQLIKTFEITHSFPHDWRTKKPIIFLATNQWFIDIKKYKDEIDRAIVAKVKTNIEWNKERLRSIISERKSWTISRQRLWGVPIVAFFDENGNAKLDKEIVSYAISQIKEKGINSWYSDPTDSFLPEKYKNKGWKKEKDILDVWFDSGSSNVAIENIFKLERPFDLCIEGGDQYRGWFNSSMINSIIFDGKVPYKKLASHGMVVDEKGRKMSKSKGNGIDPLEISSQYGSDILRIWVFSSDFTEDVKFGSDILKQSIELYRKIRNTTRFLLNNVIDFNSEKMYQNKLADVDQYILYRMSKVKSKIFAYYDENNFLAALKLIMNYIINDLSAFYLDFAKDILYIYDENNVRRKQIQTVLYENLWFLIDVLRPIIPHTIEEVYQCFENIKHEKSVVLLNNKIQSFTCSDKIKIQIKKILHLRDQINEKLEIAKNESIVKKGFEAIVKLKVKKENDFLKSFVNLHQILIVNNIQFDTNFLEEDGDLHNIADVQIIPAVGEKCSRCWSIVSKINKDELCERCVKFLVKKGINPC